VEEDSIPWMRILLLYSPHRPLALHTSFPSLSLQRGMWTGREHGTGEKGGEGGLPGDISQVLFGGATSRPGAGAGSGSSWPGAGGSAALSLPGTSSQLAAPGWRAQRNYSSTFYSIFEL
jgi:hypothetical protein